jgi:replicative DNA helicase
VTLLPIGTEPPNNAEAEQALLGAVFYDNKAFDLVADLLRPEHFYSALHQRIFEVIGDVIAAGKRVTPTLVKGFLIDGPWARDIEVGKYLNALLADGTSLINVEDYATQIRDYAARRDLIEVGRSVVDSAWQMSADGSASPESQIDDAERRLFEVRQSLAASDEKSATIGALAARIAQRIDAPDDSGSAFPTGLADLDWRLGGGFRRAAMIVTAGRPGMGKTAVSVSLARRIAASGLGVLFIALEPGADELGARLMADELAKSHTPVPYRDIMRGAPDAGQADRVRVAAERLADLPLVIDTTGSLSMPQIEARVRRVKRRFERQGKSLALVVIDQLSHIVPSAVYRGRKVDEIGETTRACVAIAKRHDVCVNLLAQLNREVEKRDDKRPQISDLRDSGAIEQDADVMLLAYRPAYYAEQKGKVADTEELTRMVDQANDLDLIVAKNRWGPPGTVPLYCDVAHSHIDNKARYG